MKRCTGFFVSLAAGFFLVTANSAWAGPKPEAELVKQLYAKDWHDVHAAVVDLVRFYPTNTDVIPLFKIMLHNNSLVTNSQAVAQTHARNSLVDMSRPMPPQYLARQAARALAAYHADMSEDDLKPVYGFLESSDIETKMDGLKALRGGFKAPDAVPHILPLLNDPNQHVLRDACRTLAVIGDKSVIPSIKPLLKSKDSEVRGDAERAIFALNHK